MQISSEAHTAFERHAISVYPQEACGLLVDGSYLPCDNKHPEPTKSFRIDPALMVMLGNTVQAILHSHPYNPSEAFLSGFKPEYPSEKDIDSFNHSGLPWGIAATDGTGISEMVWMDESVIEPLLGRKFIWGVNDCFSLGRDWYRLNKGVTFYNVPRQWGFWEIPEKMNTVAEWFEHCGFVEIPFEQADVGDGLFFRMGDRTAAGCVNHIGVVTGPNEFIHQLAGNSLSHATRIDKWRRSIAKVVRYKPSINTQSV